MVKSLRSFLNPIFSKNYTFAKVDWIIFLYILARDPFKSSYTKKLKVKKNFLACDHFFWKSAKTFRGRGGHQKVHVAFRGGYQNVYVCLQGGEGGSKISEKWLRSLCTTPIYNLLRHDKLLHAVIAYIFSLGLSKSSI